mmetsp:Transcript_63723/g.94628  ORF Transcript_63723/g.94628 Transcript_63723/m.94628 type:complete len:91 (-) Transcript_63723:1485-1757(-)
MKNADPDKKKLCEICFISKRIQTEVVVLTLASSNLLSEYVAGPRYDPDKPRHHRRKSSATDESDDDDGDSDDDKSLSFCSLTEVSPSDKS